MFKTATPEKQGLPKEYVILWRKNVCLILKELEVTQTEFAHRCGITQSHMSKMLNRDDYYPTTMQAAAVLYYIDVLLDEAWRSDQDALVEIYKNRWRLDLSGYLDSYSRKKNTPDNEGQRP